MNRLLVSSVLAIATVMPLARASIADTFDEPALYINTTIDMQLEAGQCLPGNICTLRSAVEVAQSFKAAVRACFEHNCPLGASPLTKEDPNYDPVTDRWTIQFDPTFQSLVITQGGMDLDLSAFVDGWQGPQDNKIVVHAGDEAINHLIRIEGSRNTFAGFELRGRFQDAAIIVGNGATGNQFGPGLALAGFPEGVGIRIMDAGTTANKVVGTWCGFTVGEGGEPVVDGVQEDCVQIVNGASENVVGGPEPGDRNVLSGSLLGFGVALRDNATRKNVIQGNYIGTDPSGQQAAGNGSGIMIADQATGTEVVGNVISGNRNAGILTTSTSTQYGRTTTLIESNLIGTDATGGGPVPNGTYGIEIHGDSADSPSKHVTIIHNQIKFNRSGGVLICGPATEDNTVSENSITANGGSGIKVCEGANGGVRPPAVTEASLTSVDGTACPGCRIEIFSDDATEAAFFEGWTEAEPNGAFWLDKPSGFRYRSITTTATDGRSTSGLSNVWVNGRPTLTPTLRPGTTPEPTRTPRPTRVTWRRHLYVPIVGRNADYTRLFDIE